MSCDDKKIFFLCFLRTFASLRWMFKLYHENGTYL